MMHVNVSTYFILELCHASNFYHEYWNCIFVTELGPVVVQGGRVYFSSLFTHFLLTRITFLMLRLSRN